MNEQSVLLLTDIVDSTLIGERLGRAVDAALRTEHDTLSRDLLKTWRGHELERSDGFLMRFDTVSDAVEFAIAYHRAIGTLANPLKARVGIHVGQLELTENNEAHIRLGARVVDVGGPSIAMTARIMSLAMGGQTLLSAEARIRLGDCERRVESLGHWRLKGIAHPIEIFEVGDADAPFAPPPDAPKAYCVIRAHGHWLPRREVAHSLPAERNAFIGRESSLQDIRHYTFDHARLVTVLGAGGTGKTRLAQHFGWRHLGDFIGGVWFCDLSQATTFEGLCGAVAQGLDLPLGPGDIVAQIGNAIAGRSDCLVILDNFEQVVGFAQATLAHWLDRAPDAHFIVTTRTILGLDGERVLRLTPLETAEAAVLFADRARAANPDFRLTPADEPLLSTLVDLLDRLPLAIELAAARARIMDLPTLIKRMNARFSLLTVQDGRPARHAKLSATLDWSWDLLSITEQSALVQAAVFEGGFDLGAFEAVIELPTKPSPSEPIDVLQALVEKSWLQQAGARRFGFLTTIYDYLREKWGDHPGDVRRGQSIQALQRRHWRYFGALHESAAMAEKCVEIDNLVCAVRNACAHQEASDATKALCNAWIALKQCGPYRSATGLAAAVLQLSGLTASDRAEVEYVAGNALQYMGEVDKARNSFESGLVHAKAAGSLSIEARLMCALGEQQTKVGLRDEAASSLEAAFEMACRLEDDQLQYVTLNALGTLAQSNGDNTTALQRYQAALSLAVRSNHERWIGAINGNLGIAYYGLKDLERAKIFYEKALASAIDHGDLRWIGNTRSNLGLLLCDMTAHDDALTELNEALRIARHLGHLQLEYIALWNVAIVVEAQGKFVEAIDACKQARVIAGRMNDTASSAALASQIESLAARAQAAGSSLP